MMSVLVEIAGWLLFVLFLVGIAYGVHLERAFFGSSDPENWHLDRAPEKPASNDSASRSPLRFPAMTSPGNPS